MKDKLLKSLIVAMFVVFGAFSSAQAEMKCPTEKCDMKMPKEAKDSKCDINANCPNNGKCDAKMKQKCIPKVKEKCADGKCPTQESAKK